MTTVLDVQRFKDEHRRFAVITAYDFLSARILDEAGIPILLVGDSLGNVMLGYTTTLPVTLDDMIHHAKAVARGARQALLVGDMPFMSYHTSPEQAITSAGRFLQEAGMHAVKVEGGGRVVEITRRLTELGIPVMGHLGLTPQSTNVLGGVRRVQGRGDAGEELLADARALDEPARSRSCWSPCLPDSGGGSPKRCASQRSGSASALTATRRSWSGRTWPG